VEDGVKVSTHINVGRVERVKLIGQHIVGPYQPPTLHSTTGEKMHDRKHHATNGVSENSKWRKIIL
jgi:hypothetical protein